MHSANAGTRKQLTILLAAIIVMRLVSMVFMPLTDTTEARYANTALMMANLNDWITPFFRYHEPFLGKPPLAFWFEAISYKLFGIADVVPRLPSLLITLATVWLIYKPVALLHDKMTALLAALIYLSTAVVFVLSGVVMTDPFLVFGTTLSLVSFLLVICGHSAYWRYLFFVGAGIGILTKGPLALVIIGGIVVLWILPDARRRLGFLKLFPWVKGTVLMCLIFVPWYAMQEIKNPGFLYYFIVGENLGRFLDTGWHGDKYGYVHKEARGMIWLFWIAAALPWSITAMTIAAKHARKVFSPDAIKVYKDDTTMFYWVWALFIMLFFTFGGNVLWYYTLPSMGGFAILLARTLVVEDGKRIAVSMRLIRLNALAIPVLSLAALVAVLYKPTMVKTEKYLVAAYHQQAKPGEKIYFIGKPSFSAAYYMNTGENLKALTPQAYRRERRIGEGYYLVVNRSDDSKLSHESLQPIADSKGYVLYYHPPR